MTSTDRKYLFYCIDKVKPVDKEQWWFYLINDLIRQAPDLNIKEAIDYADRFNRSLLERKVL